MGLGLILSEFFWGVEGGGKKLTGTNSGIFSQSNFGIVTKMGMTLMPNPGGHESFVSGNTQHRKGGDTDLDRCTPFPKKKTSALLYAPPTPYHPHIPN